MHCTTVNIKKWCPKQLKQIKVTHQECDQNEYDSQHGERLTYQVLVKLWAHETHQLPIAQHSLSSQWLFNCLKMKCYHENEQFTTTKAYHETYPTQLQTHFQSTFLKDLWCQVCGSPGLPITFGSTDRISWNVVLRDHSNLCIFTFCTTNYTNTANYLGCNDTITT
jgi:hypothetical protein